MTPELLKKITALLKGEDGKELTELVEAITKDQTDIRTLADDMATMKVTVDSFGDLDVAKAKAIDEVLKNNDLDSTDKLINLVKGGEATEAEKAELRDRNTELETELSNSTKANAKNILDRDVTDSITTIFAHGNKSSAIGAMLRANADAKANGKEAYISENGVIKGLDGNGVSHLLDSKEYGEYFNSAYGDMMPKPANGSGLPHDQNNQNNSNSQPARLGADDMFNE